MSESREKAVKSIFRGSLIVLVGTIFSKILSLIYRLAVGRTGVDDLGIIGVTMTVFSIAGVVSYIGIPRSVQKYISEYRGDGNTEGIIKTFQSGMILITISSTVVALLLFVGAPFLSRQVFNEPRAILPIRMIAVILPFRAWSNIFMKFTDAYERMEYSTFTGKIWNNSVQIVITLTLLYLGFGYIGAAFGYAVSFASGAFVAGYFAKKIFPGSMIESTGSKNYREIVTHAFPLMATGILGLIIGNVDTLFLQYFKGTSTVGIYTAVFPFATLITTAGGMFGGILLSNASKMVSQGKEKELANIFTTVTKWTSLVTVPVFLLILAFPEIPLKLFGTEYVTGSGALQVLSFGFMISTVAGPVSSIYQAFDRTELDFYTSLTLTVSNVALNLLLIPRQDIWGGLVGAAIASSLSYLLISLIYAASMKRLLGKLPYSISIIKIWIAGITAIASTYLVSNAVFNYTPAWFLPIAVTIFGVTYILMLLILRTIQEDDLIIMRAIENKLDYDLTIIKKIIRKFS